MVPEKAKVSEVTVPAAKPTILPRGQITAAEKAGGTDDDPTLGNPDCTGYGQQLLARFTVAVKRR